MRRDNPVRSLFAMLALLMLAVVVLQGAVSVSGLHLGNLDSPIATPITPVPIPTPSVTEETQRALKYIAEREGIPVEQLVVVNQHRREYELLSRAFWAVTALDTKGNGWYNVMVDLADGRVVGDVEAIEQAEREAQRARYGKLEPALFERLETLEDGGEVPVVIWVAGRPKQSEDELYAALAAKYPKAQAALERSGKPFDVGDSKLGRELEAEYVRMLEAGTQEQVRPLVHYLEGQGHAVITLGALPAIAVTLPKAAILQLDKRGDVGVIYLGGKEEQIELDSAVPSDRVPAVWQRGFEGNGVHIGVLEGGRVDFDSPQGHNYLNQGAVRPCAEGVNDHKTRVASTAASFHPTYTGVAPEATIVDACTDGTDTDTVAGLEWAASRADPINYSAGFDPDDAMHFLDRAFDYWARSGNDTITKSSSDTGGSITSPGKGWNVITVGGSDNQDTSAWSDDEWWAGSGWRNPTSDHGDREKPEVVAPAASIHVIGPDRTGAIVDGTSPAAPQVAGLAALLIDRNSDLGSWPEAVRAIIMASAVNNIDGPSVIPTDQDLRDGAGAIDASLADTTAKTRWTSVTTPCSDPCWWGISIDNTSFPVGTYLYRYFNASRGEHVRVAISWWSNADCPDEGHCNYDRLDTDLHLGVMDPDGQWVDYAWSASWDNNYELVEFTAPKTGQYRIAVYKARADEASNYLGIAWVKDATYLPELRNKDGWSSELYICNNGATYRSQWASPPNPVYTHYFDSNGNPTPKVYDTCTLGPNQCCWIPVWEYNRIPAGTTGSAIVSGGEDVSVVVENQRDNKRERTNYTGILSGGSGSLGWEQAGSTMYAPIVKRQRYGRSSTIQVTNAGAQDTTVYVYYYDGSGNSRLGNYLTLPPNGTVLFFPSGGSGSGGCSASGTVCSARIYSSNGQPLAGVVQEYNDADGRVVTTHNMLSAGATTIYFPIVKYERYNNSTGLRIQNVGSSGTTVTVNYYRQDGSWVCSRSQYLARYAAKTFFESGCPGSNFSGSAVASASQSLAGMANETSLTGPQHIKAYSSFQGGSHTAYGPLVCRTFYQGGYTWDAGIAVQNLDTQSVTANLYYYYSSGARAGQQLNQTINGRGMGVFFAPLSGFTGSVLITANRDIAAVVNVVNSAPSGDSEAIYNASNR